MSDYRDAMGFKCFDKLLLYLRVAMLYQAQWFPNFFAHNPLLPALFFEDHTIRYCGKMTMKNCDTRQKQIIDKTRNLLVVVNFI